MQHKYENQSDKRIEKSITTIEQEYKDIFPGVMETKPKDLSENQYENYLEPIHDNDNNKQKL
jgi:hypothetical protein